MSFYAHGIEQFLFHLGDGAFDTASCRVLVPPASESVAYGSHVNGSLSAHAYLVAFRTDLTQKNGHLDAAYLLDVFDKTIGKFPVCPGCPEHIPLTQDVKPGETIQIKVDLVAPKQDGQYTVFYELQDETGMSVPNSQIWVTITVGNIPVLSSMGVSAQLISASMENSEFTVNFCMQLPDGRQWYPWNVLLLVNQQDYSPSGSRIDPVGATTSNKCFSFSFPVLITSGTTYQLSIGKVELPPEVHQAENCAYAQTTLRASYPGLDFKCAGPGAWYTNLVLPSGMTKEQADQLILDAMSSSIYGPWTLSGIAP